MDIQSLKTLMEINALQSFGSIQPFSEQNNPNATLFSAMLGEVLSQSTANLNAGTTINPLMYQGQNNVFIPTSLAATQQKMTQILSSRPTPSPQQANDFSHIIKKAAEQFGLPERLISSVIKHESNFDSHTVSNAGAQGLMQLMPGTAKFLGVTDSFDPEQNIMGGARYLKQMMDQFNGDTKLALAAYNAGPGNVRKFGGIPPFKETQNYVNKVLNSFQG